MIGGYLSLSNLLNTRVSIWALRAFKWMDVHKGLERLHLLCFTHAFAPVGALSAQILTSAGLAARKNNRGMYGSMNFVGRAEDGETFLTECIY